MNGRKILWTCTIFSGPQWLAQCHVLKTMFNKSMGTAILRLHQWQLYPSIQLCKIKEFKRPPMVTLNCSVNVCNQLLQKLTPHISVMIWQAINIVMLKNCSNRQQWTIKYANDLILDTISPCLSNFTNSVINGLATGISAHNLRDPKSTRHKHPGLHV